MRILILLFSLILIPFFPALAQQVSIELGKSPVPIDQYFTVSVTLENQVLKTISKFPEIEGFHKSNRFSSTTTNIINGQISTAQTVTQNYAPLKEGEFQIKPFSIEVNGQKHEFKGGSVTVVPPEAQPGAGQQMPPVQGFGLLDELFGDRKPREFIDKKEDAFLAFSPQKSTVFAGEGLHVDLSFYVARADQNLLDFYNLNNQFSDILKQLKPNSVWEEVFDQSNIEPEFITIEGKEYMRFKLYEAVYFPINSETLLFPSVGLQMIKYKVAKSPVLFGDDRQATYKTYYTAPKIVEVKPLPAHPLRQSVPVGDYKLKEGLDRSKFIAGKSFNYVFTIEGEGNLAMLPNPEPLPLLGLEFTTPDVRQNIARQNGRVYGQKGFRFFMTPKKRGTYDLSKAFSFIFFNPVTAKYDTLHAETKIKVTGETDTDAAIQSKDMGEFYERIPEESNELLSIHQFSEVKLYTNLVVLFLLLVSIYLFYKHRL
jgi:hypothetical protein